MGTTRVSRKDHGTNQLSKVLLRKHALWSSHDPRFVNVVFILVSFWFPLLLNLGPMMKAPVRLSLQRLTNWSVVRP